MTDQLQLLHRKVALQRRGDADRPDRATSLSLERTRVSNGRAPKRMMPRNLLRQHVRSRLGFFQVFRHNSKNLEVRDPPDGSIDASNRGAICSRSIARFAGYRRGGATPGNVFADLIEVRRCSVAQPDRGPQFFVEDSHDSSGIFPLLQIRRGTLRGQLFTSAGQVFDKDRDRFFFQETFTIRGSGRGLSRIWTHASCGKRIQVCCAPAAMTPTVCLRKR